MAKTYYVRNEDGSIGRTTTVAQRAREWGVLDNVTEENIVYFDGKQYLESEVSSFPNFIEVKRKEKLSELRTKFINKKNKIPVAMSSLGYPIDAGVQAFIDVSGLIDAMEDGLILEDDFCDADNNMHQITITEAKIIRNEIIGNSKMLYAKKWGYRKAIKEASSVDELNEINIVF